MIREAFEYVLGDVEVACPICFGFLIMTSLRRALAALAPRANEAAQQPLDCKCILISRC
jgi:hypothetical protein